MRTLGCALPLWALAACRPAPEATPVARPPNILLVSLDTLRADHTTPYHYARDTTPTLSAVAARGTVFQNAFSDGNESAYSHGALFTGRYASELADPTYETYAIPPAATLLSEALQAYGYGTAAFTAGGHVTADFGFDQGWDHFSAEPGFASLFDTGPRAVRWIKAQSPDTPWFVFLHTYDAHRPYTRRGPWDHIYAQAPGSPLAEAITASPCLSEMVGNDTLYPELLPSWFIHRGGAQVLATESYDRLDDAPAGAVAIPLDAGVIGHVRDHYDGAVVYEDTMLGVTLARLQASGALDHTIVILVSDHGEDLLDHGYMNHRTGLYDSCTRVPLIVMGEGFAPGVDVDGLVDSRDVAATIFALGGAQPPAGSGGHDLRAIAAGTTRNDAVFSEGVMDMVSVRTQTARLVYQHAPLTDPAYLHTLADAPLDGAHFQLFDLATDPGEQVNLLAAPPGPDVLATAEALRQRLIDWRRGLVIGSYAVPQANVSPAVARQLRDQGYWEAEGAAPTRATPAATPPDAVAPDTIPDAVEAATYDPTCADRLEFLPPKLRAAAERGRQGSSAGSRAATTVR